MSRYLLQLPGAILIFAATSILFTATLVAAESQMTPLVSAHWLRGNLDRGDIVVVDIRGRSVEAAFVEGHVPGAVWSAYPGGWRGDGRVPGAVPSTENLQDQIATLGVSQNSSVVIVPAGSNATEFGAAARVYWSFKYAGHAAVAILDGGWPTWIDDPINPVESGWNDPAKAGFVAHLQTEFLATTPIVSTQINSDTVLMDARPMSQYTGKTKSAAALLAGHLPGAISLDSSEFYDADANRIKSISALAALMPTALNDKETEVIAYCNAGHWSATNWFVLHELLGYQNVSLYVDSMPGWTQDPGNPVEK